LSTPNGARLERALSALEYMVSIDLYRNETTRHANLILPTSFGFERDHYDVVFYTLAVRNAARYVKRLVKGPPGCVLLMHPEDAAERGLRPGARARVESRVGSVEVPVGVTADVARGVVSLPHGWGHTRQGAALGVASAHAGASLNDLTDEQSVDALSGNAAFSGVPVSVTRAELD
ncbi:MAG TPA: molybdopterin dinucleotide binding domain-containing protein, partial [Myxococcales bacterium]|nr:molybdopterin dinucleotide binding domain-containing protein [Myxococcales bacterium]